MGAIQPDQKEIDIVHPIVISTQDILDQEQKDTCTGSLVLVVLRPSGLTRQVTIKKNYRGANNKKLIGWTRSAKVKHSHTQPSAFLLM